MPNHKKESELYPAIGKAVFVDQDAFFKWYLEEGGYGWLNPGVSYQSRMSGREKLFESMVPGYWDFYRCFSGDSAKDKAAIIRKINTYINNIGGRYDVLLCDPDMTAVRFGSHRFLIPTRFMAITLFPDYRTTTLTELNRALLPKTAVGESSQSDAMAVMGELTMSDLYSDLGRQDKLIDDVNSEIAAVRAEMERKIEAIRAEARAEMARIERMKLALQVKVEELQTKVFMLESVIYSVECYLGDTVDFIRLRSGNDASAETPLVVHQKLRYLDEELPILVSIYGFRFESSELFEEALKNRDDIVEHFCPSEKCMSFVRVSKTASNFGINEKGMLQEYELYHGRTVGILLRNGENLYFGWTDEAKVILPDGNVFYTPKIMEIDPEDARVMPEEVDYPSRRYSDAQLEAMTADEKKELADKDQIAYHLHQRGFEKRKVMARVFIFAIIQGLLDNAELVSIPEQVRLLTNDQLGSKYLIFSNADGWLEDNRYGDFSSTLKLFEDNHKVGDMVLSTIGLRDGYYNRDFGHILHDRSVDGSSRTRDCSIESGAFYKINLIQEYDSADKWPYRSGAAYYVSLPKEWSYSDARSNFEIRRDEFINMTFLNSEWLRYAILNKKIGNFVIHGTSVSYAHAVRYLKLAYEHLQKREVEEMAAMHTHIPDLAERFPVWMVSLSQWKQRHNVRRITPYQAKRFTKWLVEQTEKGEV